MQYWQYARKSGEKWWKEDRSGAPDMEETEGREGVVTLLLRATRSPSVSSRQDSSRIHPESSWHWRQASQSAQMKHEQFDFYVVNWSLIIHLYSVGSLG